MITYQNDLLIDKYVNSTDKIKFLTKPCYYSEDIKTDQLYEKI